MIYTLTLNPAIDYVVHVDDLRIGSIGRSHNEGIFIGGKGINVSMILREHGLDSSAMGFIAGFTGNAIEQGLKEKGIASDFVHLKSGFSRINIKIRGKKETDINGQGPEITEADLQLLFEKLDGMKSGDTLVMAGSIPGSLPQDIYERIMDRQSGKNIRFVVDAAGELLTKTIRFHPFLIKPNSDELGEIFSVQINDIPTAAKYARKLRDTGARNVLVSMGGSGALLLDEDGKTHFMEACRGKVINTVGAGDSMVAGFIAGYEKTGDYAYALKLGSASGSATAFSEGLASKKRIDEIFKKL